MNYNNKIFEGLTMIRKYKGYTIIKEDIPSNEIDLFGGIYVVKEKDIMVCFNPKIVNQSEEEILMDEGCLSYPGLWLKVRRPEGIEVTYEDAKGELYEKAMFGLEARIFQHEYDHMEGTDFTKKVSRLRLDRAKKRVIKQRKKLVNMSLA